MNNISEIETQLHNSVVAFKKWARENYPEIGEHNDNGEWEQGEEYEEMLVMIRHTIEGVSSENATETMIDDILYGIARDDESSSLMELLDNYPEWFSVLCRRSLKTEYRNAKWQFAYELRNYKGADDLRNMIFDFLSANDEYTERMALGSLAHLFPEKTEKYATEFWHRNKYENDAYQKLMALHVLYIIGSDKLDEYLKMAESSGISVLTNKAFEIRRKIDTNRKDQHNTLRLKAQK